MVYFNSELTALGTILIVSVLSQSVQAKKPDDCEGI